MNIWKYITLTGLTLVAASCTHTETMSYPERWEPISVEEQQNCNEINGAYKAFGENAQYSSNGINNPHFFALFGFYSKHVGNIFYLNIASDNSTLTMSTPLSSSDKAESKTREIQISCVNGVVIYKHDGNSVSDGSTIQWSSTIKITKTKDSAIVVRRHGTSNTGSFIFNVRNNYDVLYRYSSND